MGRSMRTLGAAFVTVLTTLSASASSLDAVESKLFAIHDFRLDNGVVLSEVTLAYETYGTLAADGRNAVLVEHTFTSSHHAAGFYAATGVPPGQKAGENGWWDEVIGPGEAIDTDKMFVISSNVLGSSYGSTNPASIDPKTGRPYGPDFPNITVTDIVRAQKALVEALGVRHLVAVAGASYGGFETFEWAVTYPDFVSGIAPMFTAPYSRIPADTDKQLVAALSSDPNWNGGRYYDNGGVAASLTKFRVQLLETYGIEELLKDKYHNPAIRQAAILANARSWAQSFDANGLVTLMRAHETFDLRPEFNRIKAKVLYVLSRTDKLFPPSIAPDVIAGLKAAGVAARYVEADTDIGHLAFGFETDKWSPELAKFLGELTASR
jgi:homoserine O-acetyltransferase